LALEFLWEPLDDPVGGDADGLFCLAQGIFDNRPPLLLAEDDADGWIFAIFADLRVQRGEIELHFADKLRPEFTHLEFHGHEAFQPPMEQQQVNEVFLLVWFSRVFS